MGMADLTDVVTVEGDGELIMDTDHGHQLEQTVEVHHETDLTEVRTPLWMLLDQVVVPQPGETWEPARPIQVGLEPV